MKVAIAGFGVEGRANYEYFSKFGHDLTIVDEREALEQLPAGVPTMLGKGSLSRLHDFDVVVRSPSIPPKHIVTNGRIWSGTNEFFAKCPVPIIGVTGTKGKGTTCSFIASILRAAGYTVHLVGNIGVPAVLMLDKIQPGDVVVYELSSFQLWDIQKSPHVAVITPIEPDHLEVHETMDDYLEAKSRIRRFQTVDDICFYAPDNSYNETLIEFPAGYKQTEYEAKEWRFRAFHYGIPNERDESVSMAYINKGVFCIQRPSQDKISTIHTDVVRLPGEYNLKNACAAICAALQYSDVSDEAVRSGLAAFEGLPHRLKLVRTVAEVSYYDDSIATTPGSAIVDMQAFSEPKVMIMGGSSKGADFTEMAHIAKQSNVRCVVVMGDESDTIEQALQEMNVLTFNLGSQVTMQEVVAVATRNAQPGDTVILSPACASFGMFKNYSDRGDQFVAAVAALQSDV